MDSGRRPPGCRRGLDVTGVDPGAALVDLARAKFAGLSSARFEASAFEDWRLQDRTFHLVTCGVRDGEVVLLRWVVGDIVELNALRQGRSPDELPVALPDAGAKRLDIVHDLGSGRGLALADRAPDVEAVQAACSWRPRSRQPS